MAFPLGKDALTHSCLVISLARVVWTLNTFQNSFGIDYEFTKYLKESCGLDFDKHFSFNYFLIIAFAGEKIIKVDEGVNPGGGG